MDWIPVLVDIVIPIGLFLLILFRFDKVKLAVDGFFSSIPKTWKALSQKFYPGMQIRGLKLPTILIIILLSFLLQVVLWVLFKPPAPSFSGSSLDVASLFTSTVIIAPIREELIYRVFALGLIFAIAELFSNKCTRTAILNFGVLLVSIVFVIGHDNGAYPAFFIVSRFSASILFSVIYYNIRNPVAPILAHSVYNLTPFIFALLTS